MERTPCSTCLHVLLVILASSCHAASEENVSYHVIKSTAVSMPSPNDSSEDPLSELRIHRDRTRFVVQRVLVPLVILAGLAGNVINIVVLTQKVMRTSSTNIYLTALALFDTVYLVFALVMSFKHYESIAKSDIWNYFYKPFGKPLIDIFSNTAVWLTLTFTVERYIGVCHPMKGKVLCTPARARYVVIIVCFTTLAITFPEFFENRARRDESGDLREEATPFGSTPAYRMGYVYVNQALFTFLPLLLLFIFNTLLTRAVISAGRRRSVLATVQSERQERQHKEQTRITIMLIIVVVVFLMCQLPQAVQNLYQTYLVVTKTVTQEKVLYLTITANIFNLLVTLNAATNFVWYSCFSMRFRRTFKRIFCRCLVRKTPRDHLFTDAVSDNSKTNLLLHAPYTRTTTVDNCSGAVTKRARASPSTSCVMAEHVHQDTGNKSPPRNRNGYLKVNQGSYV